jgi:hypothetical protein
LRASKPKALNRIAKIDYGHISLQLGLVLHNNEICLSIMHFVWYLVLLGIFD